MGLSMGERRAVTKAMRSRYAGGTKAEKSEVLDALCATTGWHRDHARRALRQAIERGDDPPPPRRPRPTVQVYDEAIIDALRVCWAVLDGPCGKILAPALPALIDALRRCGELDLSDHQAGLLGRMSPATIDRRLAADRAQLMAGKGRSMTKPGSLLKTSIPMKTWTEWSDTTPGFVEIDLVSHDGGDNNGEYCWTLCVTNIATGWTQAATVMGKGERRVAAALEQIWLTWPVHIAGIHSDNGSEFINHHLMRWCQTRQITFSRSRPTRSNDNAWVEQKNWSIVRRCAGYFRYDTARELSLLNELWAAEMVLINLFKPQQKLATKKRQGAHVSKTYHPAMTPFERLDHGWPNLLCDQDRQQLHHEHATANPADLCRQVALLQANLIELARRRGPAERHRNRHHTYTAKTKLGPPGTRASSHEATNQTTRAS